jgi:hypothetical protein
MTTTVPRRAALGRLAAGGLGATLLAIAGRVPPPAAAQTATPNAVTGSPLVGSWAVAVTVQGQPPLVLPNLATFAADGTVVVAAPPRLPELPGTGGTTDLFSGGHGAWIASGERGARVRFAFLVSDQNGQFASTNTVRGILEVDATGNAYLGSFDLDIADPTGHVIASSSGTWQAVRIAVGPREPIAAPLGATPSPAPAG